MEWIMIFSKEETPAAIENMEYCYSGFVIQPEEMREGDSVYIGTLAYDGRFIYKTVVTQLNAHTLANGMVLAQVEPLYPIRLSEDLLLDKLSIKHEEVLEPQKVSELLGDTLSDIFEKDEEIDEAEYMKIINGK